MNYLARLASRAAGQPAPLRRGTVFPVEIGETSLHVESIPEAAGEESGPAMTEPVGAPSEPDGIVQATAVEDSLGPSTRPTSEASVEPASEPRIAIETAEEAPTEEPVPAADASPGDAGPERVAEVTEVEMKPRPSEPVRTETLATPGTPARHASLDTRKVADLHESRVLVAMPVPLSDRPEVNAPSPKASPGLVEAAPPTVAPEPAPIDLHIGTIEIVSESAPTVTASRQEPAGFGDYELLRTYEWDS